MTVAYDCVEIQKNNEKVLGMSTCNHVLKLGQKIASDKGGSRCN